MADPTNPPEDTTPDAVGEEQVAAESTDEAQQKLGAETSAASEAPEVVVEGDAVVTDEDLEDDVGEDDEPAAPRVKPAIPGADLEVDIVREGEEALRGGSAYDEDEEDGQAD